MFIRFGLISLAALTCGAANAGDISGTGATFPKDAYNAWGSAYTNATHNRVNYQGIGSGGGIKAIKDKTVDFGASDKPLEPGELNPAGLFQFPTVVGGVVPIVNIPGVTAGQLHFSGALLADIYLGQVKNWSDVRIHALNPKLKLPNLPITVVHRSDGSGTTFIFTSYLKAKSPVWARVGANDSVNWPVGVGGPKNDGVSSLVKQTVGSIGYVEYVYARKNHESFGLVQNKSGQFPEPNEGSFAAAASGANWAKAPGNYQLLIDEPGAKTWPISGATFILIYKNYTDSAKALKAADVLRFFDWSYKNGDKMAGGLDFVPLPAPIKALMRREWAASIKFNGKPVYVSK